MASIDLNALLGTRLAAVEFSEPASWVFTFADGTALRADCPWRIIAGARIAIAADDHGQQFGRPNPVDAATVALKVVTGRDVTSVRVADDTGDILMLFGTEVRFEVFVNSSGFESWDLSIADGRRFIALGGGEVASVAGAS